MPKQISVAHFHWTTHRYNNPEFQCIIDSNTKEITQQINNSECFCRIVEKHCNIRIPHADNLRVLLTFPNKIQTFLKNKRIISRQWQPNKLVMVMSKVNRDIRVRRYALKKRWYDQLAKGTVFNLGFSGQLILRTATTRTWYFRTDHSHYRSYPRRA